MAFFKNFKKKYSKKFWFYEKENQQLVNPNERPDKNIQFSEDAPDTEVKLSKPVDIGKLRLGMESFHGSLETSKVYKK